jgi:hypothetical protein
MWPEVQCTWSKTLIRNNHDITVSIGHITDSEIAAAIRCLDPTPTRHKTDESDDTVIVVVVSVLMFLMAALPFISLYLRTSRVLRPIMSKVISKIGPRKTTALAFCMLIVAMLLFYRCLTTSTPDAYFLLPLALYAGCLTTALPAIGQGAVGKLDPGRQLDGVQIYMTFRQLGASLGVAFLTILLERRETLHSSRLYEHLNTANETTSTALSSISHFLYIHSGASPTGTRLMSVGLLARAGAQQVETLSYADCFLFMAMSEAPILFYSSAGSICRRREASRTTSSESDREGNAADLKGSVHTQALHLGN